MAEMPYVCLYKSYMQTLAPFTDAERGRIMMAMLSYSATGEIPLFEGNERFIWPFVQNQIDRDLESYRAKCLKNRTNGAKGGRPPKNPTVFPETERLFDKPKKAKENENENENKKENGKENERENIGTGTLLPPTPFSPPSIDDVRKYCNEHGYTTIDPERFVSFYESVNWMVRNTPITDWKAKVQSWHRDDMNKKGNGGGHESGIDRLARMYKEEFGE